MLFLRTDMSMFAIAASPMYTVLGWWSARYFDTPLQLKAEDPPFRPPDATLTYSVFRYGNAATDVDIDSLSTFDMMPYPQPAIPPSTATPPDKIFAARPLACRHFILLTSFFFDIFDTPHFVHYSSPPCCHAVFIDRYHVFHY